MPANAEAKKDPTGYQSRSIVTANHKAKSERWSIRYLAGITGVVAQQKVKYVWKQAERSLEL